MYPRLLQFELLVELGDLALEGLSDALLLDAGLLSLQVLAFFY